MDKILVVDDEPDTRDLARLILVEAGYEVIIALNPDEGIMKAEDELPDLILLDVVMPGKSGFEVCKHLKFQTRTRLIPVVMFSVLGREIDYKLAEEAGADDYLLKPFKAEDLLAKVKEHLERGRARKFSERLGLEHDELRSKKILFEFDPTTQYERLIRDFTVECNFHGEKVIVISRRGSAIQNALEGDEGIEFIELTPQIWLSPILQEYQDRSLSIVYDNLTDLDMLTNFQSAYNITQNTLKQIDESDVTAIFLLNPSAHDPREVSIMRGLFKNQVSYDKEGITNIKIV